jgi:hypothetical protein
MTPSSAVRCMVGSVNGKAALAGTEHCAAHDGIAW